MREPDYHFVLDPELGVELLASAGDRVDYPWHSHVSSCVLGLVRRGAMTLRRRWQAHEAAQTLRAGEVFIFGVHEAHRLSAAQPYGLLNLCVEKHASGRMEIIAERLAALCRDGWLHASECATPPTGNDALAELGAFLETHPEASLSLDDLSRRVQLDKFQLIRQFRRHYGVTPHRFQMQNRIRYARRACLTATSFADLALAAGFYDQSHFIREFRKATKVTPSQYRRAGRILPSSCLTTAAG